MIAIKIGTVSWRQATSLAADEVEFVGEWISGPDLLTPHMVWDAGLNNARAMTAQEIAALPGKQATAAAKTAKTAATASVDSGAAIAGRDWERLMRGIVELALDEFNARRTLEASMLAQVAAASSLADLKTRYAALTSPSQVTIQQFVTALKAKIAATPE